MVFVGYFSDLWSVMWKVLKLYAGVCFLLVIGGVYLFVWGGGGGVHNQILTPCQLHRVTSGQMKGIYTSGQMKGIYTSGQIKGIYASGQMKGIYIHLRTNEGDKSTIHILLS